MRKFFTFIVLALGCLSISSALDEYDYRKLLIGVNKVDAPQVKGKYLLFTQDKSLRHAGIAFEFEDYKTVHTFQRIPLDNEGESRGILFYILEIPEDLHVVNYRLELDGLWTDDPQNDNNFYDYTLGLSVSSVEVPYFKTQKTMILQNGNVQFYYEGEPGKTVRLAGSFNSWDPFMYEMQEVKSGEYFLTLPLPRGKWVYAFFIGTTQIRDETNHNVVFSDDGKAASVIEIE